MSCFLATAPLTAQQTSVLFTVLLGVVVLMGLIRGMGEILARTHPDPVPAKALTPAAPKAAAPTRAASPEVLDVPPIAAIDPATLAIIAAAMSAVLDGPFRILSVSTPRNPPVEGLMQVWSWEGRRQIYSSHRPR